MPNAKTSDRYLMYVDWSDEDQLYLGYCPDLFYGGVCHAENRLDAYTQLVQTVEDDFGPSRVERRTDARASRPAFTATENVKPTTTLHISYAANAPFSGPAY